MAEPNSPTPPCSQASLDFGVSLWHTQPPSRQAASDSSPPALEVMSKIVDGLAFVDHPAAINVSLRQLGRAPDSYIFLPP